MKKVFYIIALLSFPVVGYCQSNAIVPDQNPRFQESQDHYMKLKDSLVALHGITVQNTYKAYDWREAREARRQQRRQWRHEERLAAYYSGYDYNYGYSPYYSGYYSPSYYYSPYSGYYSPRYYSRSYSGWGYRGGHWHR